LVSRHPLTVITLCLLLSSLGAIGWIQFRLEHKANKLWIPGDSSFNMNKVWLDKHFPTKIRTQAVLIKTKNVLTPESINLMYQIQQAVASISTDHKTLDDICTRVAIGDIFQQKKRKKRETKDGNQTDDGEGLSDYEDDYYDFWADYEADLEDVDNIEKYETARINFSKFGVRSDNEEEEGVEDDLPTSIYCDLVESLTDRCAGHSLLEIWRYQEELIKTTSQQEIIDGVNLLQSSPWFSHTFDFSSLLGGVSRNRSGHLVSATTALMFWQISVPDNATIIESQGSGVEVELGDATSLAWEEKFVETVLSFNQDEFEVLPNAVSSFGNESADAIFFDGMITAFGYILMVAYACFTLGPLSCVENRVLLSLAGIVSILLGLVMSIGISSALGYPYTLVHAIMPFLCLGIGIDDMFVIVQCLNNVKSSNKEQVLPVSQIISQTMRHAGVSITVTSITDITAFGVGYFTNMPGLQSFCIYASIGLGCIFLLQCSWFLAWLVLDERRIRGRRNGILPCCFSHQNVENNPTKPSLSQPTVSVISQNHTSRKLSLKITEKLVKQLSQSVKPKLLSERFSQFRRNLVRSCYGSLAFRVIVIAVSCGALSVGVFGFTKMEYKFDPVLLVPAESYFTKFIQRKNSDLPTSSGHSAQVFTGEINGTHLETLNRVHLQLENIVQEGNILESYESWWTDFVVYLDRKTEFKSWQNLTGDDFQLVITDFLFSKSGSKFQNNFNFLSRLECGWPAPPILASSLQISYLPFDGPSEHGPARAAIETVLADSHLPHAISFNKIYLSWETDSIIDYELWRNVGLGLCCIFVITFLLLANIQVSFMVMLMVTVTLVDIVGYLYFWDITIDIVSCINIIISVGLCVDYSVHIGHSFVVSSGSRLERTISSLEKIGPAVLNGGLTTFLALILCGTSTSHTFITFFKVFVLTVMFGLYHGLLLLPALLSFLGPEDHRTTHNSNSQEESS